MHMHINKTRNKPLFFSIDYSSVFRYCIINVKYFFVRNDNSSIRDDFITFSHGNDIHAFDNVSSILLIGVS